MMEIENQIENGCKIVCIFFKDNSDGDEGEKNLKLIAKLGGTNSDKVYTSNSLEDLSKVFETINKAIKTGNFGLKLTKNS